MHMKRIGRKYLVVKDPCGDYSGNLSVGSIFAAVEYDDCITFACESELDMTNNKIDIKCLELIEDHEGAVKNIIKGSKFKISSREQFEELQKALFHYGCDWSLGGKNFLPRNVFSVFVSNRMRLTFDGGNEYSDAFFEGHNNKLIDTDDFIKYYGVRNTGSDISDVESPEEACPVNQSITNDILGVMDSIEVELTTIDGVMNMLHERKETLGLKVDKLNEIMTDLNLGEKQL